MAKKERLKKSKKLNRKRLKIGGKKRKMKKRRSRK